MFRGHTLELETRNIFTIGIMCIDNLGMFLKPIPFCENCFD